MDAGYWHERWEKSEIGFHERDGNALLVRHFASATGVRGGRVFLPLCGKTRDIGWLLSQGYRVVGAELSRLAVDQLFAELALEPAISDLGKLKRLGSDGVEIFVGDIFDLGASVLGPVDVVYDRGALVALPEATRLSYAAHMVQITDAAPQFLVTFEYDQAEMAGPPFSMSGEGIHNCYGDHYELTRVASSEVVGGLKGRCAAIEHAWLLQLR
jgi:thiopurine S-methyltransferase